MRALAGMAGLGAGVAMAAAASAQNYVPSAWSDPAGDQITNTLMRLDRQARFEAALDGPFGPAVDVEATSLSDTPFAAASRRDAWFAGDGFADRVSLTTTGLARRGDGAPLPAAAGQAVRLDESGYDLRYVRGWTGPASRTASGLEVSLTPHAGVGLGSEGRSAEAGATLRIGSGLNRLVQDGQEAFGERPRWYLYAAGSGRAVGYNFARNRDGDFARSGVSHDSGTFMGDASVGVALRRGPVQSSFGVVYRKIKVRGLRTGHGDDTDATEGLVAFQLSIKPGR
ncbi:MULTISPECIES: lipid A-modifier LpxR family protein [unclassified Brevundimonas]|uniref:lipid A-modifier LpxR family protein n=1 Tax=unclassified Brevundimonas TaxID=2622653 RepID=UPI001FD7ED35|nr:MULTISPECIES: lipid A-modifier LpxR family protein [unclassified Brevundimonas]